MGTSRSRGVAERQTLQVESLLPERASGFKSRLSYQKSSGCGVDRVAVKTFRSKGFECPACRAVYFFVDDARGCCRPADVDPVHECSFCLMPFRSEGLAERCYDAHVAERGAPFVEGAVAVEALVRISGQSSVLASP